MYTKLFKSDYRCVVDRKKRLPMFDDNVVQGTTCFSVHAQFGVDCERRMCRNWLLSESSQNCAVIAAQKGPHTLQSIGELFGLTRMRICQIERKVIESLRSAMDDIR